MALAKAFTEISTEEQLSRAGYEVTPENIAKQKAYFSDFQAGKTGDQNLFSPGWEPPKPSTPNPVDSTDSVRKEFNSMQAGLNTMQNSSTNSYMNSILESIVNPQAVDTSYLDELRKQRDAEITNDEQSRIDLAKKNAGGEYDALIAKAEEEKRKGMPKATIAAGERGGFMNTQFAGRAALQSTQGGDFVGAGGELESIKSAYDLNISQLQGAKINAMNKAEASMRAAIATGRSESFNDARSAYMEAQDLAERQSRANQDKLDAVIKWNKVQEQMNAPVLNAEAAVQDFALESMQTYLSGFSDLSPQELAGLTLNDIQQRIMGSDEYQQEIQNAEMGMDRETQVVRGGGGKSYLIDKKTGEIVQDYGYATSTGLGADGSIMPEKGKGLGKGFELTDQDIASLSGIFEDSQIPYLLSDLQNYDYDYVTYGMTPEQLNAVSGILSKGAQESKDKVNPPTYTEFVNQKRSQPGGPERQDYLAWYSELYGNANKGSQKPKSGITAGEYYSNSQLSKGASNAGMSVSEFEKLDRDEANQYIYPSTKDKEEEKDGMSEEEKAMMSEFFK